jgi:hypothetical protein
MIRVLVWCSLFFVIHIPLRLKGIDRGWELALLHDSKIFSVIMNSAADGPDSARPQENIAKALYTRPLLSQSTQPSLYCIQSRTTS